MDRSHLQDVQPRGRLGDAQLPAACIVKGLGKLGKNKINKTQCQLCKTLAWPIISHSWFGNEFFPLEQPFFCVLGVFGKMMNNEQPTGWSKSKPVLDQWEVSLLQNPDFQIVSHRLAQPEVSKDTLLRLEEMFRQQPEWVSPTMWKLWSDFACKVVCQGKDNNKRFLQYLTTYLKR